MGGPPDGALLRLRRETSALLTDEVSESRGSPATPLTVELVVEDVPIPVENVSEETLFRVVGILPLRGRIPAVWRLLWYLE
eukprot:515190-Prorocentrum_lima.AAC.1